MDNGPDDIDRLFAALAPLAPPPALLERALAQTAARARRRRQRLLVGMLFGYGAALVVLVGVSFALGRAVAAYGADAILALVVAEPQAVVVAPGDLVLAVTERLPFALVAILALVAVVVAWCIHSAVGLMGASPPVKAKARHG